MLDDKGFSMRLCKHGYVMLMKDQTVAVGKQNLELKRAWDDDQSIAMRLKYPTQRTLLSSRNYDMIK